VKATGDTSPALFVSLPTAVQFVALTHEIAMGRTLFVAMPPGVGIMTPFPNVRTELALEAGSEPKSTVARAIARIPATDARLRALSCLIKVHASVVYRQRW